VETIARIGPIGEPLLATNILDSEERLASLSLSPNGFVLEEFGFSSFVEMAFRERLHVAQRLSLPRPDSSGRFCAPSTTLKYSEKTPR